MSFIFHADTLFLRFPFACGLGMDWSIQRREKCDKVGTDNHFLWGKGKKEVLEEGKSILYIYLFFYFGLPRWPV